MEDPLDNLRDEVARQDEHSHVDAAVRQRVAEVVLEVENEPLEESARRIVERLSPEELAQLVADWLEAQRALYEGAAFRLAIRGCSACCHASRS